MAPPPAPDDVARWLLRCMRGRTEGGSFKDPDQGRAVMEEALMNCRVLLERTRADDVVAEVEDLRLMARSWLARYTQLNAQSGPWASASAPGAVPLEVRYPGHSAHALGLRRQFAHRITYRTEQARQAVESFNVDCRGPDGRFLPLSNVILAKLASMSAEHAHLEVEVDTPSDKSTAPRNEEVRDWLIAQGMAKRTAEVVASLLRADGVPTGPR